MQKLLWKSMYKTRNEYIDGLFFSMFEIAVHVHRFFCSQNIANVPMFWR